ncbi:MAG: hypothetical protein WCF90_07415, partial [Methanomicrobiales archaeon]
IEREQDFRVFAGYAQHRVADRVGGISIDRDQGAGNLPGEGKGIDLIDRVPDGAFPCLFLVVIPD